MVFLRRSSNTIGLRTGTLLTASFSLLLYVVVGVGVPVVVHTVVNKVTEMIDNSGMQMIKDIFKPLINTFVELSYYVAGACGVMAIASLILLFGAMLETKKLLVPFLLLQPLLYLVILFGIYRSSQVSLPTPTLPQLPTTTPAAAGGDAPPADAPPADAPPERKLFVSELGGSMKTITMISGVMGIFLGLILGYFSLVVGSYYVDLWKEERYRTRLYILKNIK